MDFRQMRYFNTLAVVGNMSKAAKMLNISQSTLSKSIARLESDIGCELFDRNGKNIALNNSGKIFFDYSFKILDLTDRAVMEARQIESKDENRIQICIIGDDNTLVKYMNAFTKAHPTAVFSVDEILLPVQVPDQNYYDLIICPDSPKYTGLEASLVKQDKFYLCVNSRHPLADKIAVTLKELDGLDMVFIRNKGGVESIHWGLEALGVHSNKRFYVGTRSYHKQMIASGMVAGFVSTGSKIFYEDDNSLRFIPVLDNRFSVIMKFVFKPEKQLTTLGKAFKDYVLSHSQYEYIK